MSAPPTLDSLPNEILLSILTPLPIPDLLSLLPLSHRLYATTITALHDRLLRAAALPRHELQLECFVPAQRLYSEPSYCTYQHTDALPVPESDLRSLPALSALYSHFRPLRHAPPSPSTETIHLDESEPFAQLCTAVNIVRRGPRRGLFLGHVGVAAGLIRVWRGWLAGRAAGDASAPPVLWADAAEDVGVRFGVVEREGTTRQAVLVAAEEDCPVSYRVEFTEVLVRTRRLLGKLERSETEGVANTGNAVIIGAF